MTPPLRFLDSTHVEVGGESLLYFGGCNYLGLSRHPSILSAMRSALREGQTQPGASRRTTGEHLLYQRAELELARFLHLPSAVLVSSGYLAPLAAVQALRTQCSHVLVEIDAHPCLSDAAIASGLPVERFLFNDSDSLGRKIRSLPSRSAPLVLLEGTRGTLGGVGPVKGAMRHLPQRARLIVDDAHGTGAIGPGGRGILSHLALSDSRILLTTSLAKAVGVAGGAVAGSRNLIRELQERAPSFAGSTSIPLTVPAGIIAALNVIRRSPRRLERLRDHMELFHHTLLKHPWLDNDPYTPVTRICLPDRVGKRGLVSRLLRAGIFPSFVRYATGPAEGFFRFALTSEHRRSDVSRLVQVLNSFTPSRA